MTDTEKGANAMRGYRMKSFSEIQRLAFREVRSNLKVTLSTLLAFAVFLLCMSPNSRGFNASGMCLSFGALTLLCIFPANVRKMFSKLYDDTEEAPETGEAGRKKLFFAEVWAVLQIHIVGAIVVSLPVIASVGGFTGGSGAKLKYMLLHIPLMVAFSLALETLAVISAVCRRKAKHLSISVIFLSLVTGILGLAILALLSDFGRIQTRIIVFPWEYKYVFDTSSGYSGFRYTEVLWFWQALLSILISVAAMFLMYRVFRKNTETSEAEASEPAEASESAAPEEDARVVFGTAITISIFLAFVANYLSASYSFPAFVGISGTVYFLVYYFHYKDTAKVTLQRFLLWACNLFVSGIAFAVLMAVMYMTDGFGIGRHVPFTSLDGKDIVIDIPVSDGKSGRLLFHAGSYNVMYHPDGEESKASMITADRAGDRELRKIAEVVQRHFTESKKSASEFVDLLFYGSRFSRDLSDYQNAVGFADKCYLGIYRASEPAYLRDINNYDPNGNYPAEENTKTYLLEQLTVLNREEIDALISELRELNLLTERHGTEFRYFWNSDAAD